MVAIHLVLILDLKSQEPNTNPDNIKKVHGPGTLQYELKKLIFFNSVHSLLNQFDLEFPEDIMENGNFKEDIMKFLEKHQIALPTEFPSISTKKESKTRTFPGSKKKNIATKSDKISDSKNKTGNSAKEGLKEDSAAKNSNQSSVKTS